MSAKVKTNRAAAYFAVACAAWVAAAGAFAAPARAGGRADRPATGVAKMETQGPWQVGGHWMLVPPQEARLIRLLGAWRPANGVPLDEVIKALDQPEPFCRAALFTLARAGNAKAIPAVHAFAGGKHPTGTTPGTVTYARVVEAQLRAAAGGPAKDLSALRQQMAALLAGVGVTADEVNRAQHFQKVPKCSLTLAVQTAGQIADMALMAADRGVASPAGASPVDLSYQMDPRIKAEYSAYPPAERVKRLVESLAACTLYVARQEREVMLLIDEAELAKGPVIGQLRAMAAAPGKYSACGAKALVDALACIAGPEAADVALALTKHPDIWAAEHARRAHRNLLAGRKRYPLLAY